MRGGIWCKNLGERYHLEDLGVYGRIVLKWIFNKYYGGVEWVVLVGGRDRWLVLVNAVMNLQAP